MRTIVECHDSFTISLGKFNFINIVELQMELLAAGTIWQNVDSNITFDDARNCDTRYESLSNNKYYTAQHCFLQNMQPGCRHRMDPTFAKTRSWIKVK